MRSVGLLSLAHRRLVAMALFLAMAPSGPSQASRFTLQTLDAGLSVPQFTTKPRPALQPYMSGGAAAGDFDGDGWDDLYITRLDSPNLLYRNRGDGTFEDVTQSAFGGSVWPNLVSNGAAWGDIDNDGDLDLYVTSLWSHQYQLFINSGNGTFTENAVDRGAAVVGPDLHFGFSPSFGDYDQDGYLDLYTTEWRMITQNPTLAAQNSRLLHNLGAAKPGYFTDVTSSAKVSLQDVTSGQTFTDSQSFTGRFADLDGDQWPDLAIASDHGTSRLFWNNGDGTFRDGTRSAQVGTDQFGMGSAIGDYDRDGDLDWFVSSIYQAHSASRDGNRLYQNQGTRTFSDQTDAGGVRDGGWGWGSTFVDIDNDGDLDLAQASGESIPVFPSVSAGFETGQTHLWRNEGDGRFTEVSADWGLRDAGNGKGLLAFDYDRDGDQDLLVINNGKSPSLWRNDLVTDNHWLDVQLIGSQSNRQGIGAWITVDLDLDGTGDEQLQEITASSNFLGQNPAEAHFGLAQFQRAAVVHIRWPSGLEQTLRDVPAGQVLRVYESSVPEPASSWSWILLGLVPRRGARVKRVSRSRVRCVGDLTTGQR